jgi:hypothetical protein
VRWAITCVVLALVGCDQVLGLQRNPPDARGFGLCTEGGDDDDDDDGDAIINAEDKCPHVANQIDSDDEDLDAAPDACDLCPQVPGAAAGNDLDCDGLGAACDPQPMALNTRRFHGFSSQGGLRLTNTVVDGGVARMVMTDGATSSLVIVEDPGPLPARLESEARIENPRVYQYWSYEFSLERADAPAAEPFEIQLEKRAMTHSLYLVVKEGSTRLDEKALGQLTDASTLALKLEATLTTTRITATVFIEGIGTATVDVAAALPTAVEYAVAMHRNSYATTPTSTITVTPFLVFTTMVPE